MHAEVLTVRQTSPSPCVQKFQCNPHIDNTAVYHYVKRRVNRMDSMCLGIIFCRIYQTGRCVRGAVWSILMDARWSYEIGLAFHLAVSLLVVFGNNDTAIVFLLQDWQVDWASFLFKISLVGIFLRHELHRILVNALIRIIAYNVACREQASEDIPIIHWTVMHS